MSNTIEIEGVIGWDITARDVKSRLRELRDSEEITVEINSPGGYIDDGFGIYMALKKAEAEINVNIIGLAASMASVIAMAGDTVSIDETGLYMIHSPSSVVWGMADDMRKEADVLDKYEERLIKAYQRRDLNLLDDELTEAIKNETWYTASEAFEAGFVDVIDGDNTERTEQTASAVEWMRLAKFKNAPKSFTQLYEEDRGVKQNFMHKKSNKTNGGSAVITKGESMTEVVKTEADTEALVKAAVDATNEKWIAILQHDNAGNTSAVIEIASMDLSADQSAKLMDHVAKPASTAEVKTQEDQPEQAEESIADKFALFMDNLEVNVINKQSAHDGFEKEEEVEDAETIYKNLTKRSAA